MILLFPSLIKFKTKEDKEKFNPTCHMFYTERVVDIKDGLPKWSGMQVSDFPVLVLNFFLGVERGVQSWLRIG